jgi:hypothetical protein
MVSEWSNPKDATAGGFHADFLHWIPGYDDLFQKERKRSPYHDGHSYFDEDGLGDIQGFLGTYLDQYDSSRANGYIALPFGNHDLQRIKNNGRTDRDLEVIFAFALTMPGTPFVYYGDEIGMRQLDGLPKTEGSYGGRAGDRTPMQWTAGLNKGFSVASPERLYRAVDPAPDAPNVASQERDPASLLHKVKALVRLHNEEPALAAYAEFVPLSTKKGSYPFAYVRAKGKDRLLVVLNPAAREVRASFTLGYSSRKPLLLAGSGSAVVGTEGVTVTLGPASYAVFRVDEKLS